MISNISIALRIAKLQKHQIDNSDANHSSTLDFSTKPRSYNDNLYLFSSEADSSLPPMAISCNGNEFFKNCKALKKFNFFMSSLQLDMHSQIILGEGMEYLSS